jgi:two-component system NtrC family sensor kinase
MIKIFILTFLFAISCSVGLGQNRYTDSLLRQLSIAKDDTSRVLVMAELCFFYRYTNIDSSVLYGQSSLALAQKIKYLRGEANALNRLGLTMREKGDLPKSLELQFKALKIAKDNNYLPETAICLRRIGLVYIDLKDYPKAIGYLRQAMQYNELIQNSRGIAIENMNFGIVYEQTDRLDSALYFEQKAFSQIHLIDDLAAEVYRVLANIQSKKGNNQLATAYYQQAVRAGLKNNDYRTISFIYANAAVMYQQMNKYDSSIYYAKKGLEYGQKTSFKKGILASSSLLSELYDSTDPGESLRYYKIAAAARDSLFGAGNIQTIQTIITQEEERQKEIEATKAAYQNKIKQYALIGGLAIFLVIAAILYRNNRQKLKANRVLEKTLSDLKSTQSQLIQSEKMASLGELTAGIAHEIQNPLNFVNNFSEVNAELIAELKEEIDKGNLDDAKTLANDISDNEQKINHHGRRADAIVKGMLQHSRSSTSGTKEPTNINALADEYLRLAYHGLRAKDKSFNAVLKTDFDESIGNINIIPQDIGRVILNLINNAFYAVNERKKQFPGGYEPTVSVGTKREDDKVLISVKDNGNGIPQKVLDKIFQPFFTTKPTGQGTGLGLSLAYDIVKAHGGELKVETKESKGTEFIIVLKA